MARIATMVTLLLLVASVCWGGEKVKLETSLGDITLELNSEKAPLSVANFLKYVDEGAYDQTIFHRVIKGFMVQGGGFDLDQHRKPTGAPIKNEAGNGLKNDRGTIAMARTGVIDSATNQFFINLVDNDFLNHRDETARGFGYAVFGKVVDGMEVVDKIAEQPTINRGGPFANLPQPAVEIIKVTRLQ